ncbi:MAG: hypothetical protein ACOZHQ_01025 [Thermodesulfobacteriota bacterium]
MEPAEGNHEAARRRAEIAGRSARRMAWLRFWSRLLLGLGVVVISLIVPAWGSIRYWVHLGVEDVPEIRLLLGFLMAPVGVGLLGAAWWLDRQSRQGEKFREAFEQDMHTRERARRSLGGGRASQG